MRQTQVPDPHCLLPLPMDISRKLKLEAEPAVKPSHFSEECGFSKQHLNCWAKCSLRIFLNIFVPLYPHFLFYVLTKAENLHLKFRISKSVILIGVSATVYI